MRGGVLLHFSGWLENTDYYSMRIEVGDLSNVHQRSLNQLKKAWEMLKGEGM